MTTPKGKGRVAVPSAERQRAGGEEPWLFALPRDTKRGGVVEWDRAIVLHGLMQHLDEMDPADPMRRELEELSRMRYEVARMVCTPQDEDLVRIVSTLALRTVALVDRASGRDALAYMGAQALRQHYTRSRKGAATKREAAAETNRRLLEMYDELRETKQKGTECPKVSVSSIAEMMRRKGAFDEFGERPSKGACYRRILRLVNATGRRVKRRPGD